MHCVCLDLENLKKKVSHFSIKSIYIYIVEATSKIILIKSIASLKHFEPKIVYMIIKMTKYAVLKSRVLIPIIFKENTFLIITV